LIDVKIVVRGAQKLAIRGCQVDELVLKLNVIAILPGGIVAGMAEARTVESFY
jgi:hypothetical protein